KAMSSERISDSDLSGTAAAAGMTRWGRPSANPSATDATATPASQPLHLIAPPCLLVSREVRAVAPIGLAMPGTGDGRRTTDDGRRTTGDRLLPDLATDLQKPLDHRANVAWR